MTPNTFYQVLKDRWLVQIKQKLERVMVP